MLRPFLYRHSLASMIASATAEEKQDDDPQAVVVASAFTSPAVSTSATAEEKQDDPQAAVIAPVVAPVIKSAVSVKSVVRITAASTICST